MSVTRKALEKWLSTKEVSDEVKLTLDIGGDVWSMKHKLKKFGGMYFTCDETVLDLNKGTKNEMVFDNIFALEIMQFVYNPYMAIQTLRKLLVHDGRLFISFHLTHPPMKGNDYLRYTRKGVDKLLEDLDIREVVEPLPGYFLVECSRSQ